MSLCRHASRDFVHLVTTRRVTHVGGVQRVGVGRVAVDVGDKF